MRLRYYIFFIVLSNGLYRNIFTMRSSHKSSWAAAHFGKIYLIRVGWVLFNPERLFKITYAFTGFTDLIEVLSQLKYAGSFGT